MKNKNQNSKIQTLISKSHNSSLTTHHSGITLIALVVTIVVLLILAGVTITLMFGDNNIFETAKTASEETRGGAVEDVKNNWQTQNKMSEYTNKAPKELSTVLEELLKQKLITDKEKQEIEDTGKVTIGSRTIEFTEQIELLENYYLEVFEEELNICFSSALTNGIEDYVVKKVVGIDETNNIDDLTDEELYMTIIAKSDPQYKNKTFQQLMQELSDAGTISEPYATLKEYMMAGRGNPENAMPEEIYEREIKMLRERYPYLMSDINSDDIKVITPEGTELEWGRYTIPYEPKDYIFTIKYLENEWKIKVSIKEYEIVTRRWPRNIYALDVKNKKFLNINSAKVIISNEINIDNKYIKSEEDYKYVDSYEFSGDFNEGNITTRSSIPAIYYTTLICDNVTIKGFAGYDIY